MRMLISVSSASAAQIAAMVFILPKRTVDACSAMTRFMIGTSVSTSCPAGTISGRIARSA